MEEDDDGSAGIIQRVMNEEDDDDDEDDDMMEEGDGMLDAEQAAGSPTAAVEDEDGDEETEEEVKENSEQFTKTPQLRNYQQVALLRARDRNCVMVGTTGVGKSNCKRGDGREGDEMLVRGMQHTGWMLIIIESSRVHKGELELLGLTYSCLYFCPHTGKTLVAIKLLQELDFSDHR